MSKTCYCKTCDRAFHPLGIARHRAMHRDKKEDCVIVYSSGDVGHYDFAVPDTENEEDD